MWEALLKEKETANARAFAQSYLGDPVPSVFSTLHEQGFFLRSCWERYINAFVQAIFLSSCLFSFKSKHASPHHDLLCWCWHDRSPTTAMTYYVGADMTGALPLPWPTMLVLTWQDHRSVPWVLASFPGFVCGPGNEAKNSWDIFLAVVMWLTSRWSMHTFMVETAKQHTIRSQISAHFGSIGRQF